MINKSW